MEIKIKTAEEFHDGHVTIEIRGTQDEVVEFSGQRISGYDPAAAVEAMTENYHRATARIKDLEGEVARWEDNYRQAAARVKELVGQVDRWSSCHVCTERCTPDKHVAFIGRQRLTELEGELEAARQKIADLDDCLTVAEEAREIESRRANKAQDALIKTRSNREEKLRELEEELRAMARERDHNRAWAERVEAQLLERTALPYVPYQVCCPPCQKAGKKLCDHVWCGQCNGWRNDTGSGPSCMHEQ